MFKQKKPIAAMLLAVIFSAMLLAGCGTTPTAGNATTAPTDAVTATDAPTQAPTDAPEATQEPAADATGDATGADATGDAAANTPAGATNLVEGMTIELPGTVTPITVTAEMAVVSAQDGANTIAVTAMKNASLEGMTADAVKTAIDAQLSQFNMEGAESTTGKRTINGAEWDMNITTGKLQGQEMYVEAGVKDGYMILVACSGADAAAIKTAADVLGTVKY